MIDRARARSLCSSIGGDAALTEERIASFLAAQPCFRNKDFPFALTPLCVSKSCLPGLRSNAEAYVRLLEKIVALYRRDPAVRAFYNLGRQAERLIEAEGELLRSINICRLDGYVTRSAEELRVLENNADAPAGTFFTPRINQITRALLASHLGECPPEVPMDDRQPFLDALLDAYREAGGTAERPFTAILQPRGKANRESDEVAAAMNALGWPAVVADPRELIAASGGLMHHGKRIELVWNKINAALWNSIVANASSVVDVLCDVMKRRVGPVHLNSFGARHVAEAKTSLGFVHDPRFADRFTPAEKQLIGRLVPWTARLERGAEVRFDGIRYKLAHLLQARQAELVVKQQYDIRGDGVTVGRSATPEEWNRAVESLWDSGAVVQRYIAPAKYPVILAGASRGATPMNVSLDSFVFNGKFVGLGAKASTNDRVNVFQGGSKIAVLVTETN